MIYLDHAATWPLLEEVREVMLPWLGPPANPASAHRAGQAAAAALESARTQVAALVGADPAGVVFTSGATEANHLFLAGAAARLPAGAPVAVSAGEHPCVFGALEALAAAGHPIHRLPVDPLGAVDLRAAPPGVALWSVMALNHETGATPDLEAARAAASRAGALLHVDASQAAARIPVSSRGVDGMVLSSHKLGGPVGIGALVLRTGGAWPALLRGGGQERGRRAGTPSVASAVGFGAAAALAARELAARRARWEALGARLEAGLVALGGRVVAAGGARSRSIACAVFSGVPGELVVQALDLRGICASHGAACASGSLEPSPVLRAMGEPEPGGAVRVSMGPGTTEAEVDALLAALAEILPSARAASGP